MSRPSTEPTIDYGENVFAANTLQSQFDNSDLQLRKKVVELNTHNLSDGIELESQGNRDPEVVAVEVASQISYLRKLKFQYLEQNAKDKYVKSIVSDIDDAPIVTAEQNNKLASLNEEKKGRLKVAKRMLADVQNDIRLLAPMVEKDYVRLKGISDRATFLAQNIVQTRKALMLLRQTHPYPRLTIPLADDKLADQVTEMQRLSDEVQTLKQKNKVEKGKMKDASSELENLRGEAAEAEKMVKLAQVEEDDSRVLPLYDWYTASQALHRSIINLEESHCASENELLLTYRIDTPVPSRPHRIVIRFIFAPDTRQLADAEATGLEELGVEIGDLIDSHVQIGDVHGFVAAVLMRARAAVNS